MRKFNIFVVLSLCFLARTATASYSGPFLFWGMENLNNLKVPTLQAIDDKILREIYAQASSIVVFIRNSTTKLNYENFPRLSEVIGTTEWLYLPQETLSSDPLEFNVNAEVFVLTGPVEQQDVEIAALYRDAQVNYGKKNILGVLATRKENIDHSIFKRQAIQESTSEMPLTTPADDPVVDNLVYVAKGKGILYTTVAPILKFRSEKSSDDIIYSLDKHLMVTADERGDRFRLIIKFQVNGTSLPIRFDFQISGNKWSMNQVEVEMTVGNVTTLDAVGVVASAPLGFSYACGGQFLFRKEPTKESKESISLLLSTIQVQPLLDGETKFSKAYDCVGAMSPAILSGIFISFILCFVLTIAITAILDIKAPNKFENRSSKQLTFTVQE